MPGIGELIEGAVQQAAQPLRHVKAEGDMTGAVCAGWASGASGG